MKRTKRLLAGLLAAMLLAVTVAPTGVLATGGRATGVTTETPATTEELAGPARRLLF